jgi:hypothetical protein
MSGGISLPKYIRTSIVELLVEQVLYGLVTNIGGEYDPDFVRGDPSPF